MKAAVVVGGSSALSACAGVQGEDSVTESTKYPRGPDDLSEIPSRQHSWGGFLPTNRQNQIVFPQHQVFLFLEYTPNTLPTDAQRAEVESVFRTLERAFQRGAGTKGNPVVVDGLLFSIAYSRSYFDLFDQPLPDSVGLKRPEEVVNAIDEDTSTAERFDAVVHLGSDEAEIVLAAEEALFEDVETINGIDVEGSLSGVFERSERRPGWIGSGIPSEKLDQPVSDKSPIPMGFKSAFSDTLPTEDSVTIEEGPFEGGTTQHISQLIEDLDQWYGESHEERIKKMFDPSFSEDEVGAAGEQLGNLSTLTEEMGRRVPDTVREDGLVGHSQKLTRVRNDDFDPIILRRGDFFHTDGDRTVLNFGAIHESTDEMVRTLKAMYDAGFEEDESISIEEDQNGILSYIRTESRSTFLMPPRELRSLPTPRPS